MSTAASLTRRPAGASGLLLAGLLALAGLLSLTACSGAAGTTAGAPSSSPASSSPAAGPEVTVTVSGSTVSPAPKDIEVARGTPVRLIVTSATANQVHVHGVDIEKDLPAGQAVTFDLRFPESGVYEVETHEPPLRLLRFVVR